jgi:dipeptidyl aminopeptidase/acylaminoacyl peptidase
MSQGGGVERLVRIGSRVGQLTGILHLPDGVKRPPCVVGSHGLYSDRESGKLQELGQSLVARGVAFLRYDCMGCGDSDGEFGHTTLASRVADLTEAVAWVRKSSLLDTDRVGLMGSSMGAFASLCLAANDPGVAATAAWAAPATFEDLHDEEREQGTAEEETGPEVEPILRLGPDFYRTLDTPDLPSLAPSLANIILLHGDADETVPLAHAVLIHRLAGDPKRIEIFPGGDHRFSDDRQRARAVALSTEWLLADLCC